MGRKKGEGLIIFYIDAPCTMESSGALGIKPIILVTEAYTLSVNNMNPIFDLSIYIPIYPLIDLLLILRFISPTLLVTALGTSLAYSTSTLALLHIDELLLVFYNVILIFLVRKTIKAMVRCITIETRIKTCGGKI